MTALEWTIGIVSQIMFVICVVAVATMREGGQINGTFLITLYAGLAGTVYFWISVFT